MSEIQEQSQIEQQTPQPQPQHQYQKQVLPRRRPKHQQQKLTSFFEYLGGRRDVTSPTCNPPEGSPKKILKGKTPYFILKCLRKEGATTEKLAITESFIEATSNENNVRKESFRERLKNLVADRLIVKISEDDTYYLTEAGIKTVDQCDYHDTSSISQSPSSPVRKEPPSPVNIKAKGKKGLVLSLYYLGATTKENAVMRSDVINEGKRFTDTFHPYHFDQGRFDQGDYSLKMLVKEGIVVRCTSKVFDSEVFYLSEEGNATAKELVRGDVLHYIPNISYELYKSFRLFEDVQTAILYTLYKNEAFTEDKGVIYPFIATEVNQMVKYVRYIDDGLVTPEYAALTDLIKKGFIEKLNDKEKASRFFLTAQGISTIEGPLVDSRDLGYLEKGTQINETPLKKEEGEGFFGETNRKRKRIVDICPESPELKRSKMCYDTPQSTPLRNSHNPKADQKEKDDEDPDAIEVIGVKRGDTIFLDNDDDDVELPDKKSSFSMDSLTLAIDIPDDDYGDDYMALNNPVYLVKEIREPPIVRSYSEMKEIDRRNAQKYPPLKIDQAFSLVHPFGDTVVPPKITGVKLIVDSREPSYMKEKVQAKFAEENLPCEMRGMYTGDYIWVATGTDGKEYFLNAIVERKKVSDFDARYRHNGSYYDQVMKMRETGISNLIYLIEGVFNREHTFHNKSFDELQQCIRNVQEQDHLKLIRTLSQEETVSFLVEITKSLAIMAREGRITGEFFGYPLRDLKGLKD